MKYQVWQIIDGVEVPVNIVVADDSWCAKVVAEGRYSRCEPLEVQGEPVIPVPETLTPREFLLATVRWGIYDAIQAAVAQADIVTQISFNHALEFRRDDPILNNMATSLGFDQDTLDRFFIDAKSGTGGAEAI